MSINNRLKAVVIILAVLSLGCIALFSGASWYVNSIYCRSLLLQELNAVIPGRVTIAHHHLSLYSGTLSLKDVTVKNHKDDNIVRIASLSIDLSPAALFRKVVLINAVAIEQPWVFLHMDGHGKLNIVDAFTRERAQKETKAPSNKEPLFNIMVRRLTLSKGYVRFSSENGKRQATLEGVDLSGSGNLKDRSGVVKLSIGASSMAYDRYATDLKHFDIAFALKDGHIEPLVVKIENQFASLLLYGDIYQAFSDPELDLTLETDVALGEAEDFFGLDRNDTGRVKALLNVKGRPHNPRLNLNADYGGGRIEGLALDRAGLQIDLTDRVATLDNLSVDTGFGLMELSGQVDLRQVFPKGFMSLSGDWEETVFNAKLRTESLNLVSMPWQKENISGRMDAQLNCTGKGLSLETMAADASAMIAIEDFQSRGMEQPAGIRSRVNGRIEAGTLWLENLEAAGADVYISANGSMDIDTEHMDARFSLETSDVTSLLSIFGLSQIRGAVTLDGHVFGRSTNPAFNVSATGQDVGIKDIDVGDVMLEAGLNAAGRLEVNTLTIENRGSSLKADGDIQLFAAPFEFHPDMPLNAQLDFSNVEYDDFFTHAFPDLGVYGSMEGGVVLSGNLQSLMARADVLVKGVEVEQVRLGDVSGKARFLDGKLLLDSLRLTNHRTDLNARGEIRLFRKGSWHTVENPAFKLDLADGHIFLEDFSKELSGELRIDTDFGGRLKAPRGRLTVKGNDLDLGVQKIEGLILDMQAEDRQVSIEPFDIVMPGGGIVKGQGRVGYDQSFQFSLLTHDLPIDSIDRVREIKNVGGQLDIDIQGRGLLQRPEISGRVDWKGIRVREEVMDDLHVQFGLKDNHISLDGKHTSDLSAEYDLSSKAFSMDLVMNDTRLAPWFTIAGRPELGGRISGSIRAEGKADALKQTRAAIDVRNLDLEFNGHRFAGTQDLRGTFNNGNFNIPAFDVDLLDHGHLAIEGSGDIYGEIDLNAEGEIPMRTANLLAPDLPDLEGTILLMTSVKGSLNDPKLEGAVRVEQGGMEIPELQQSLHRINGEIRFIANEDVVGSFSGMLDDGKFDLETTIELEGFRATRIDARATAAALPFQIPDTMEMLLNADLSINGSPDDLLVSGDIVLLKGVYYKDFKLDLLQSIQEKEREEIPPTVEKPHSFLEPLRFDVHLKHRQSFLVDNNIADLEINPDIVLKGTWENPVVTGSATVGSGIITYQNKNFEVQKGAVNFVNPYKTEAEIDIEGTVDIREWRITISLYGPPDRLVVELSSIPEEEDADIISLLVFKKTTYELNAGGSAMDQSPTVLLAQLLSASFGEDVKKSTGIDVLEVEAESAEDKDSTDRIKVTVGKDLSERVTVKYSVESKNGGYVQRASTEYKLLEHIIVSGFQDTKGVYGGEFIFRMEFRLFR
ncbi:MAG: translocation/assembly module TamB domain-containing protein [Thermodesulfobacteriota bacterium]